MQRNPTTGRGAWITSGRARTASGPDAGQPFRGRDVERGGHAGGAQRGASRRPRRAAWSASAQRRRHLPRHGSTAPRPVQQPGQRWPSPTVARRRRRARARSRPLTDARSPRRGRGSGTSARAARSASEQGPRHAAAAWLHFDGVDDEHRVRPAPGPGRSAGKGAASTQPRTPALMRRPRGGEVRPAPEPRCSGRTRTPSHSGGVVDAVLGDRGVGAPRRSPRHRRRPPRVAGDAHARSNGASARTASASTPPARGASAAERAETIVADRAEHPHDDASAPAAPWFRPCRRSWADQRCPSPSRPAAAGRRGPSMP